MIQIQTKIGLHDLNQFQNRLLILNNLFSRFYLIHYPKSNWITFEQLAPVDPATQERYPTLMFAAAELNRLPQSSRTEQWWNPLAPSLQHGRHNLSQEVMSERRGWWAMSTEKNDAIKSKPAECKEITSNFKKGLIFVFFSTYLFSLGFCIHCILIKYNTVHICSLFLMMLLCN